MKRLAFALAIAVGSTAAPIAVEAAPERAPVVEATNTCRRFFSSTASQFSGTCNYARWFRVEAICVNGDGNYPYAARGNLALGPHGISWGKCKFGYHARSVQTI